MSQPSAPTGFQKMRARRRHREVIEWKRKKPYIDAEVECGADEELAEIKAEEVERDLQARLDRNHKERLRRVEEDNRRTGPGSWWWPFGKRAA